MLLFSFKLVALGLMMLKGKVLTLQTEDNVPLSLAIVLADLLRPISVCILKLFFFKIAWIFTKRHHSAPKKSISLLNHCPFISLN